MEIVTPGVGDFAVEFGDSFLGLLTVFAAFDSAANDALGFSQFLGGFLADIERVKHSPVVESCEAGDAFVEGDWLACRCLWHWHVLFGLDGDGASTAGC